MYIGQAFSLDPISKSSVLTPVKTLTHTQKNIFSQTTFTTSNLTFEVKKHLLWRLKIMLSKWVKSAHFYRLNFDKYSFLTRDVQTVTLDENGSFPRIGQFGKSFSQSRHIPAEYEIFPENSSFPEHSHFFDFPSFFGKFEHIEINFWDFSSGFPKKSFPLPGNLGNNISSEEWKWDFLGIFNSSHIFVLNQSEELKINANGGIPYT